MLPCAILSSGDLLQDPDASNEDTDEVLTRQFGAFGDALGDDSPAVRAEAVTGLGSLLDTYWELVPAGVTAGFLQRIAGVSAATPCTRTW